LLGLALAAGLIALAFTTTGGFDSAADGGDTWAEIVVLLLGTGACCAVAVLGARGRAWGGATVALFAVLTALTALSITWSVQPDISWQAAAQSVAYLAAFAGAAALARLLPGQWRAVVGAVATASVVLSGYALVVKVFPASLDPSDALGRLQAPFGYWNAVGVMAAFGLAPCLWLSARRERSRVLGTLAPAGLALLIAVVVLSYSRSAVLVAVLGLGAWLVFVPLRLRAAAVLALSGLGGAFIAVWALATHALSGDRVALAARDSAGHTFGVVLVVALVVVCAAGFALATALDRVRVAPGLRRRIGQALVVAVALLPLVGIAALATSSRGLTGQVSHVWESLTNPTNGVGDTSGRLLQLGNSRPLYWSEGITVGEHALFKGVGAEGYATARTAYTTSPLPVRHAHSYVIQTFADLGLLGLAVSLALALAWIVAAARALAPRVPWRSLPPHQAAEREGLITLAVVVMAFGAQSAIDWTWFFSGVAIPVLVCAGWLAGRGPLAAPVGIAPTRRPILQRPGVGAAVTALVAFGLIAAWTIWQPLRAANALSSSLNAAASGDTGQAFTDARNAARIDPVSIEPQQILASLYTGAGDLPAARAELVAATRRQPANPQPWLWLGEFDLQHRHPRRAFGSLLRSQQLDSGNRNTADLVIAVRSELGIPQPKP
jgi:hypothetical protein